MNGAGGGRGAAVDEIQGTRGVDGWEAGNPGVNPKWRAPEKSVAGRGPGPPLLNESGMTTISWAGAAPSRPGKATPWILQPVRARSGVLLHNPQLSHCPGSAATVQTSSQDTLL